ncbi:MAG: hypothetical protein JO372_21440 [Solirubrobacterales bacterium]|nr:hypothetical protein [Solirubrobacterales bacterium]
MATHWQAPAHAQPVHGRGVVTTDPAGQYAELIEVAANSSLAVGSLTFSDSTQYNPAAAVTLQFETAAPGHAGQPGGAMSQFYDLTVMLGSSQHLAFPMPLVLTGAEGIAWVLRMALVETINVQYCETNVLAVGCVF